MDESTRDALRAAGRAAAWRREASRRRDAAQECEREAARLERPRFTWDQEAQADPDRPLLPVRYPQIWELYKLMLRLHWVNEAIDLGRDRASLAAAPPAERQFLRMQLAFFSQIDRLVMRNLGLNFAHDMRNCPEAECMLAQQAAQEAVHNESYALQIRALIPDPAEQEELLRAAARLPVVGDLYAWARQWMDPAAREVGHRLAAFALVEGAAFWASFAAFEYLRTQNRVHGATQANRAIARDEDTHARCTAAAFAALLPEYRPAEAEFARMADSLLGVVQAFLEESFQAGSPLPPEDMRRFTRHRVNVVAGLLGYAPPCPGAKNPFPFMEAAFALPKQVNLFERQSEEYATPVSARAFLLAVDPQPALLPAGGGPAWEPPRPRALPQPQPQPRRPAPAPAPAARLDPPPGLTELAGLAELPLG